MGAFGAIPGNNQTDIELFCWAACGSCTDLASISLSCVGASSSISDLLTNRSPCQKALVAFEMLGRRDEHEMRLNDASRHICRIRAGSRTCVCLRIMAHSPKIARNQGGDRAPKLPLSFRRRIPGRVIRYDCDLTNRCCQNWWIPLGSRWQRGRRRDHEG